jgi:hypothetical protein
MSPAASSARISPKVITSMLGSAGFASWLGRIRQVHISIPTPLREVPASADNGDKCPLSHSQAPASTSFWDALNPVEQHVFRSLADERTFAGGARIMREGEEANYVIVILRGRVKVCVSDGGSERVVAERGPGQLVGERAILQVSVRSATVVALTMVRALVMKTDRFAAFVSAHQAVLGIVEGQIYERLTEGPIRYDHTCVPQVQDGPAVRIGNRRLPDLAADRMQVLTGENCTIIFTDVVGFGSPERNDRHRLIIRRENLEMTSASLKAIWDQCAYEDRGDGLLVVVPPNIPTTQVLEYLLIALPIALKRHNSIYVTGARIQLRVALDVGPVTSDPMALN